MEEKSFLDELTEDQRNEVWKLLVYTIKEMREEIAKEIENTAADWKMAGKIKSLVEGSGGVHCRHSDCFAADGFGLLFTNGVGAEWAWRHGRASLGRAHSGLYLSGTGRGFGSVFYAFCRSTHSQCL